MFFNYFLKLSAFITGAVLLASSWLASAEEPANRSSWILYHDAIFTNERPDSFSGLSPEAPCRGCDATPANSQLTGERGLPTVMVMPWKPAAVIF